MKKYNSFLGAFFSGDNGQGGYNAGYRQSALAKLYDSSAAPEEQQAAQAGLMRVDPDSAIKWQQSRDEQNKAMVADSAKLLVSLGKDNPLAAQAWQTRIKPQLVKMYGEQAATLPDIPDDNIMAYAQQLAGVQNGAMPTDVRSIEWKLTQAGYQRGSPEWKKALNIELGLEARPSSAAMIYKEVEGPDGRKRLVVLDPRSVGATFLDGSGEFEPQNPTPQVPPPASSGGNTIVTPQDVQGAAMRTGEVMAEVRKEIARRVSNGMPVDQATSQVMQEVARQRGITLPQGGQQAPQSPAPSVAPPPVRQPQSVGAFTSRTPEETRAAEKEAEYQVQLQYEAEVAARRAAAEAEARAAVEARTAPGIEGDKAAATAAGKARGERAATGDKKAAEAGDALALLNQAESLLKVATGGYVGAKADEFAAAFGKSTRGAEANAELAVIAPKLIGLVPRFEGPQSDADRRLYENAAGDLANPNKPTSIRLAAARRMIQLYQKAQQGKTAASGEQKRIRITL